MEYELTDQEKQLIDFIRKTRTENVSLRIFTTFMNLYNNFRDAHTENWRRQIESIIFEIDKIIYEELEKITHPDLKNPENQEQEIISTAPPMLFYTPTAKEKKE